MNQSPAKWVDRLIEWYCEPAFLDEIQGDLLELYDDVKMKKGITMAKVHYILNAILFIRTYNSKIYHYNSNTTTMIGHYLKMSSRNFRKHKSFNLANLFGLTLGIAISLIMWLHVQKELSYESSYPKHDRIVRISMNHKWAKSSPSLAQELQEFDSNLKSIARFAQAGFGVTILSNDTSQFICKDLYYADQAVLEMFDIEFIHGSAKDALTRPKTMILTASVAKTVFGDQNPVGQTIKVNDRRKFEITGVIHDLPKNSHIQSDALVSMPSFYEMLQQGWIESKSWMVMYTYALMPNPAYLGELQAKLPDFRKYYRSDLSSEDLDPEDRMEAMMMADIHLHSSKIQEMRQNSSIIYVYIFLTLAAIILVIACVNFINIFTTLATRRTKEIGLRKIVGANRRQLIFQLLLESIVTTVLAASLALVICVLILPFYNSIIDLSIVPDDVFLVDNMIGMFIGALALGLISGLYPAIVVTKASNSALQSSSVPGDTKVSYLRKTLITFQFVLSLFILIGTVAINQQMDFIQTQDLGYDADKVAAVGVYGEFGMKLWRTRQEVFHRLKEVSGVKQVSLTSNLIGEPLSVESIWMAADEEREDKQVVNMLWTDENYLETLDIDLIKGRNFLGKSDTVISFIINESLAKTFGNDVIGQMIEYREGSGQVVGIMEDYHYYSLHEEVEPMVLCYSPLYTNKLLVKMDGSSTGQTLLMIEEKVREMVPNSIFYYSFLEDEIHKLYQGESAMFKIFKVFSILALLILCIGLLGLAAIEVQRRTKEVGIRKVLGASGTQLMALLGKQFVFIVFTSVILGIPISYFAITEWLAKFSYSISVSWWIFALPSIALLSMAMLVIIGHVITTVKANPVDSLRYE